MRVLVIVALAACNKSSSTSSPAPATRSAASARSTATTGSAAIVPLASTLPATVMLPAGRRFERTFRQAKLELGSHDIALDNLLLESTGAEAVSLTFGVIEHGYHNGSATLADHFETVDDKGHVSPLVIHTVELNPDNGGHAMRPYDATYSLPMHDSVFAKIRLVFASHLSLPASAVRITLDGKPLDIPLRFGPPTTDDVPPEAPATTSACDKLAKCCDAQTASDSKAACADIASSARRLGAPEQCESAASSYCR